MKFLLFSLVISYVSISLIRTNKSDFKVICKIDPSSFDRVSIGAYDVDSLDQNLCTHIVYAFANIIDESLTFQIKTDKKERKVYEHAIALKPFGVKVLFVLDEWNNMNFQPFCHMILSSLDRQKFIYQMIEFIEKYNFDGIQISIFQCGGILKIIKFLDKLSRQLRSRGLLLSISGSAFRDHTNQFYTIVSKCEKFIDWAEIHGTNSLDLAGLTGHKIPLFPFPSSGTPSSRNILDLITMLIHRGLPPQKIVLEIEISAQIFKLDNALSHGLGAEATQIGTPAEYTQNEQLMAYYEICDRIENRNWTIVRNSGQHIGPYAYKDNDWVAFDDTEMIRQRAEFIRDHKLAGTSIWSTDLDDFRDVCGEGKYPLLSVINEVLRNTKTTSATRMKTTEMTGPEETTIVDTATAISVETTSIKPDLDNLVNSTRHTLSWPEVSITSSESSWEMPHRSIDSGSPRIKNDSSEKLKKTMIIALILGILIISMIITASINIFFS